MRDTMAQKREALAVGAADLAAMLGVSRRHIERMDSSGKLPQALKFGRSKRWRVDEVAAWLAAGGPDRSRWETIKGAASTARK